jgi:hypothetical protein
MPSIKKPRRSNRSFGVLLASFITLRFFTGLRRDRLTVNEWGKQAEGFGRVLSRCTQVIGVPIHTDTVATQKIKSCAIVCSLSTSAET